MGRSQNGPEAKWYGGKMVWRQNGMEAKWYGVKIKTPTSRAKCAGEVGHPGLLRFRRSQNPHPLAKCARRVGHREYAVTKLDGSILVYMLPIFMRPVFMRPVLVPTTYRWEEVWGGAGIYSWRWITDRPAEPLGPGRGVHSSPIIHAPRMRKADSRWGGEKRHRLHHARW